MYSDESERQLTESSNCQLIVRPVGKTPGTSNCILRSLPLYSLRLPDGDESGIAHCSYPTANSPHCIYSLFSSIISPPISLLLHIPNFLPPNLGIRSSRSSSRYGLLRNKVPTSPTSNKPLCHSVILLNSSSLSGCEGVGSGGDRVDGLSNEWGSMISESEEVC
jgi:hypothetical protein